SLLSAPQEQQRYRQSQRQSTKPSSETRFRKVDTIERPHKRVPKQPAIGHFGIKQLVVVKPFTSREPKNDVGRDQKRFNDKYRWHVESCSGEVPCGSQTCRTKRIGLRL